MRFEKIDRMWFQKTKNFPGISPRSNFFYLSTEMKVAEEDGRLGAGDDQDHKHQEQEAVPVVK